MATLTENEFEKNLKILKHIKQKERGILCYLRDLKMKGEQNRKVYDILSHRVADRASHSTPSKKVRAALKKKARKDLDAYDREFNKVDGGSPPQIIPRSEAIIRLHEALASELIRSDREGFVFKGFKGLNHITNRDLSKRLSDDPSVLNCIVWDDLDFQLLFGSRCRVNDRTLSKMGLWASGIGSVRFLVTNQRNELPHITKGSS